MEIRMIKFKNRLFSFAGVPAIIIFLLSLIASGTTNDTTYEIPYDSDSSETSIPSEDYFYLQEDDELLPMNKAVDLLEPQLLVDNEYVKITALNIDYSTYSGPSLILEIENKTDEYITVQSSECQVNGITIMPIMSDTVKDNNTAVIEMTFEDKHLSIAGIEEFVTIESRFVILDTASFDRINETEVGMCKTDSDYIQVYNDSGKVIHDDNNMKVVFHGIDYSDKNIGPDIILYVENHNDYSVIMDIWDLTINGVLVDTAFSSEISSESRMYMTCSYYFVSPAALGIDKAEDVQFDLDFWSFESDFWIDVGEIIFEVEDH